VVIKNEVVKYYQVLLVFLCQPSSLGCLVGFEVVNTVISQKIQNMIIKSYETQYNTILPVFPGLSPSFKKTYTLSSKKVGCLQGLKAKK
jgi:hypothetical protein